MRGITLNGNLAMAFCWNYPVQVSNDLSMPCGNISATSSFGSIVLTDVCACVHDAHMRTLRQMCTCNSFIMHMYTCALRNVRAHVHARGEKRRRRAFAHRVVTVADGFWKPARPTHGTRSKCGSGQAG